MRFRLIPKTGAPSGGLHEEITLPHSREWELYRDSISGGHAALEASA